MIGHLELLFEELESEEELEEEEEADELEEEVDDGLDEESGSTPQPAFNKFWEVTSSVKGILSPEVKIAIFVA